MNNSLWSEKYRPNKLDDIVHQTESISVIENLIDMGNLPHLIFYGPPGTGKTSTILSICNQIFPDEIKHNRYFEFNASDDRGIKFIREKIKKISNLKIIPYDNVPLIKIIILDEVDTLTPESQYALRRIMENSSSHTRFCLICNYPNKLIEPIISRCAQFRFKPIPSNIMNNKFTEILKKEKIKNNKKITNTIIDNSYGDLRLGISYLQRYYQEKQSLQNIFGIIQNDKFLELLQNTDNKTKFWNIIKSFIQQNYHLTFQIKPLLELVSKTNLDDHIKIKLINDISNIDHFIIKGVNNEILWNFLGLSLIKHIN
jgi:replication factor C subunit 2/4